MPSSYTTSLRFTLQAAGEGLNTWGLILNTGVFQLVDSAIAGFVNIAITGDRSLSSANGATDEARMALLKFTGTLTANATVTINSVSKAYRVWNNTNKALIFTTGAGSTVTVDSGDITEFWCDGSNVKTTTFGGLSLKDYIASVTATAGAVPGVTGNAGKTLYTDGVSAYWKQPQTTDLGDYRTAIVGLQVAVAVAL